MDIMNKIYKFKNGVKVINVTPHGATFQDGEELVTVPQCGLLVNARVTEEQVDDLYVTTKFVGDSTGKEIIAKIRQCDKDVVIIGSIIAAQAYPQEVAAMVAIPGYERLEPSLKRMRTDKFTIFKRA